MIFVSWTGKGWLTYLIGPGGLLVALVVAAAVTPGEDRQAMLIPFAVTFAALTAPVQWLIGRELNSAIGWDGRREWHNFHTVNDVPVQRVAKVYVLIALVFLAIGVGRRAGGEWGIVTLAGGLLGYHLAVRAVKVADR